MTTVYGGDGDQRWTRAWAATLIEIA